MTKKRPPRPALRCPECGSDNLQLKAFEESKIEKGRFVARQGSEYTCLACRHRFTVQEAQPPRRKPGPTAEPSPAAESG